MAKRGSNTMGSGKNDEAVKVVVRIRPLSSGEIRDGHAAVAIANESTGEIEVHDPRADEREPPKTFTFDATFGPNSSQRHIYDACAAPVVTAVLEGYNGTIFAYGQTGSGKTFTMEGEPEMRGITPNAVQHIFDQISLAADQQFLVRATYLEIYNDEIRDLLSKDPKNKLELRDNQETGVYVKDLTTVVVKNAAEMDQVMQAGKKNRSVGRTMMNEASSRSHSLFTITVECCSGPNAEHIRVGKLTLVDLAGSERQAKTGATGDRLKEANNINLSLVYLGNVISALVDARSTHVPYRDSKLTRLLQNSLGGNAKTVMCANCGPAGYNYDETMSTLRYANRAKNIKNKPRINEDPKDAMLREYQEEISRLRAQLSAQAQGGTVVVDGLSMAIGEAKERVIEKIVEKEIIKEVKVGVTPEELEAVHQAAEAEKKLLLEQARHDLQEVMKNHERTAQERQQLQALLAQEEEYKKQHQQERQQLQNELKRKEEQLLRGGEVISKAAKQEAMLRRTQQELEERKQEELRLARELAERDEANLHLEEHFSSLQEEVEVKTRKLKRVWQKYQHATKDIQDLQSEFQQERNDLLETVRHLTRQVKLKELVIANFIPEEASRNIEARAKWQDEEDTWQIQNIELSGGYIRSRPIAHPNLRRPETEYAHHRKAIDPNPRYRMENIINLDLDMPERTTQEYEGPNMVSKVQSILQMQLNDETGEMATFSSDATIANPYLRYAADEPESKDKHSRSQGSKSVAPEDSKRDRAKVSKKTSSKTSSSSRPKSARKHRDDPSTEPSMKAKAQPQEELYPSARGLVGK